MAFKPPQLAKPLIDSGYVTVLNSLLQTGYDRVDVLYPDAVTEVYTFSFDSVIVSQIEIIYTDSTKANLLSAERVGPYDT